MDDLCPQKRKGLNQMDDISQVVSQENEVATDQAHMAEGLHSNKGKSAPDQAQNIDGWTKSSTNGNKQQKSYSRSKQ
jgi:hypothetical protein